MNLRRLLTNTLLTAAFLVGGGNFAWADVTPFSQDYESDGVGADWTSGNTGRYTVSIEEADGNHYLAINAVGNGDNGTTITGSSVSGKAGAGDDFTMTFDLKIDAGTNNANTKFAIAAGSDLFSLHATSANATTWKINEDNNLIVNLSYSDWYSIQLTRTGSVALLTITNKATSEKVLTTTAITGSAPIGALGNMRFETGRYWANLKIDNVVIRDKNASDVPEQIQFYVKTNYLVDGSDEQVFNSVTEMVNTGSSYTLPYTNSISTTVYDYAYKSGAETIASVTDNATRTILYSKTAKAAYADYTIYANQDYELPTASVEWTTSVSGRFTPLISEVDGNKYMTVNQNQRTNNGCTITGAFLKDKVSEGTDFTLLFDIILTPNSEKGCAFTINDQANSAAILKLTSTSGNVWKINENVDQTVTLSSDTWYSVRLVRISTNSYLTITKKSDSSTAFATATVQNLSETGGLGNMLFATGRNNANISMDNIIVRAVAVGDLTLSTAPTISSAGNKIYVDGSLEITLACETADASIRYTTDGSDPTPASALYSEPFNISATTTVKAIAIKDYAMSAVTSATYTKVYDLANVTSAETWDWSKTNLNIQLTGDDLGSLKDNHFVLKNIQFYSSGTEIPASFGDAQKLSVKGEWVFRNANKCFQGSEIKFTTEVAGKLSVDFSNTGNNGDRYLTVNGENTSYKSGNTDLVSATSIPVAVGDVTIGSSANYLRFYKVTFTPYTEVELAIIECKKYETSTAFATYIDAGTYASVAEVYAAHTAWQVENGTVTDGMRDVTKSIFDAAVSELGGAKWNNANVWDGSSWNEKYTEEGGAPDNNYFDVYQNTITAKQTIYGVPAGVYVIKAATRSAEDKGVTGNLWVFDGTSNIGSVDINSDGNTDGTLGKGWSWSEMTITLTENKNLEIGFYADASSSEAWAGCDDWHMYKIESVPASVSTAGYATFSSAYALDFTENTDVTAYVATGVEVGKVTMTSVEKVPANTGLLLKSKTGAAVSTTIPVIAETVATPETNYLKPGTGAAVAASTEGTYHYIFAKQNGYVGFFNLASDETVDVGKAYLETTTDIKPTTPGARVAIVFGDDETTGIQELKDSRLEGLKAGDCYNLSGQRVSQPTKGLYIKNGKKVILK